MAERKKIPYSERKFDRSSKTAYDTQYAKDNYYRPSFVLPKEYKDILKNATSELDMTLSEFIRQAIDEKLNYK